jgi:hypothetical protein
MPMAASFAKWGATVSAGLTGSPGEGGAKRGEKGLARSGNARVRRGVI